MRRFYFYLQWRPPEDPFWWDTNQVHDFIECSLYLNADSFQQALSYIQTLPGKITKILPSRNLDDFTDEELHNQGYINALPFFNQ